MTKIYTTLTEQYQNPIENDKVDTPNTQNCSLSWLVIDTSLKSGGVKLVSEIVLSFTFVLTPNSHWDEKWFNSGLIKNIPRTY